VAFLKKFSGMSMEGDMVANDLGPDNVQKKHLSNLKWTPGKATVGIGMGKGMYDWIQQSFAKGQEPKHGRLVAADFNYKAQSALNFEDAIITEVVVPKLAGDSKEAAYFDVSFDPERVRWEKGGGEDIRAKLGAAQKAWLCANFLIEIGDLPCMLVNSIDSFTWKCSVAPDAVGRFKEPTKHAAKVTIPDLKLNCSMKDHQAWADCANKWFVGGCHLESDEMDGRIVFLGPDLTEEIGEITLMNVGFKKFSNDDKEANSEKIARFTTELYCEQMKFSIKTFDA
jgi:hypothetical protein